ncbi:KICSTOR complex protein kaptin [Tribolium castaneum]|uniref:Kaptin-like Protein n=1 Tax=Tribolium castaneum TaxID=7070 RepID=D6WTT1_TRICA|nr:PREDICTED: kaptin [Tribolium castaneum]EFA06740.2 Kaptin-like Protein [Tribolium castaneum]|eukprot:XP_974845.1 PREDICTED: kaptin [Tribolium castaneum]
MDQLEESHYFHLPSQGNIYTITHLEAANCPHKILVASLKRDIFCIEYQESGGCLIPTTKEVSFTYIPSGAEIISVDAFNKSATKNEFVIGITIIKNSNLLDSSFEYYLNIYSEWEESDDFNIDNIAQNCLNVELSFTPYQLTHTDLIIWENEQITTKEIVFLLSGSDNQIHIYREYTTDHLYKEVDKECFPEFIKTPSPVVWIDIYYNDNYSQRVTAMACECGYVRLTQVCVKTNKLSFNFSTKLNNYISHLRLYPDEKLISLAEKPVNCGLNLVVVNTILPPVLFQNVLVYGLSNYVSLPRHDYTCVLTCCQVADVDFDGEKEILVGNSSEEIMLYKRDPDKGWCLEELKMFASPIISMKYVDLIEDGVNELVVLSMKGVHFLQHDFTHVDRVLNEKIKLVNF